MKTNTENRNDLIKRFLHKGEIKIDKSDYEFLFHFDTYKNAILNNTDKEIIFMDNGKHCEVSWCLYYKKNNCYYSISDTLENRILSNKIKELYPYSDEELLQLNKKVKSKNNKTYTPDTMAPGKYKNKTWLVWHQENTKTKLG